MRESMDETRARNANGVEHTKIITGVYGKSMTIDRQGLNGVSRTEILLQDGQPHVYLGAIPPLTLDGPAWELNNDFNIILFARELDDTLMLFTRKFWEQLRKNIFRDSYGTYTWGLMPLASDITSLADSLDELVRGINPVELVTHRVPFEYEWDGNTAFPRSTGSLKGEHRLTGTVTWGFPDISDTSLMLRRIANEIGFHPDINTVWDGIPFSFVVDYFLPIGDLLESAFPQGWVDYTPVFSGWASTKIEGSSTPDYTWAFGLGQPFEVHDNRGTWSYYHRRKLETVVLGVQEVPPPRLEFPSLRQLISTTYLRFSDLIPDPQRIQRHLWGRPARPVRRR